METEFPEKIGNLFGLTPPEISTGPGGTAGSNYLIQSGGERYLLRTRSEEHNSPESIGYEHALVTALSAAGLPVAPPLKTIDGESSFVHGGKRMEILPWIDGVHHKPGDEREIRSLGRTIAQLHLASKNRFGSKHGQLREDDPNRLIDDIGDLFRHVDRLQIASVSSRLDRLRQIEPEHYGSLPRAVIHGDLHPGNILFLGGRLVALLDFDWANRRERIRDIGDCLIFFCAERVEAIDPGDIWSLTQGFRIDLRRAAILISAYCEIDGIVASEVAALPTVLSLRWLQMRIRGGRKVSEARRLEFLDRGDLMEVLDAIAEIDLEGLSRAD